MALDVDGMVRFLRNWAGLAALVGLRIKPISLGQEPTYPIVTYFVVDAPGDYSQSKSRTISPRVQFDCYATTYRGTHALAEQVREGIEAYGHGIGAGCFVNGPADMEEPPELGRWRVRVDVVLDVI